MITQEQLNLINKSICLSIIHGGDCGGPYFSLSNYEKVIFDLANQLNCEVIWYDYYDENGPSNYEWKNKYDFYYEEPNNFPWLCLKENI